MEMMPPITLKIFSDFISNQHFYSNELGYNITFKVGVLVDILHPFKHLMSSAIDILMCCHNNPI